MIFVISSLLFESTTHETVSPSFMVPLYNCWFSMMYDAVIIGAGPGGYVCAIEISKLGGKVCIVEKNGFGGTCTQRGCIPTKYLHSVGDFVRKASMSKSYGIDSKIDLDYKILKI